MSNKNTKPETDSIKDNNALGTDSKKTTDLPTERPEEKGGPQGPEPTRYGDWEIGGKCVDF